MSQPGNILVTSALPYANGDIHIGHLVEYLQTDFWVRFQKMIGRDCIYICADDTHGTPIMIRAQKEGIQPEELIAASHKRHLDDFNEFQIKFDHFSSTNSEENRELCEEIFLKMEENNHISSKKISQSYCADCKMFLPDRFVKGQCPKCKAEDQYGDSCDSCGATYSPTDMKNASCTICNAPPVLKESEHVFFQLDHFRSFLKEWVHEHTPSEVANKLDEWLAEELRDWDISRDAPYFGFSIPGHEGKFFYVWVDAPIGYISSSKEWCKKNNRNFEDYWKNDNSEIYHFIGKDIVYFHTLFWPAMLKNAGYKTPNQVFVHGFLTVNGEKMSKSKGTFINARTYLNHLDPMFLRYYYGCKLNSSLADVDLNFDDFISRVNSDLIGKITNLASRGASMLGKNFSGEIKGLDEDGLEILDFAVKQGDIIKKHYLARDFNKAVIGIRDIAEKANRYFDEKQPWKLLKTNPDETQKILGVIINTFRKMAIYLKPILPEYVAQVEKLFNESDYQWQDAQSNLTDHNINRYEHLAKRVDEKQVNALMEETKAEAMANTEEQKDQENHEPLEAEINIDDLFKADLRVAKIIEAEEIKEASKLLRLTVDLGFEKRNIIAGIKQAYKAEDLVGRLTVIVANLKPRKMKFGTSEGMVLAAGPGGKELFILSPDSGAKPGQRIQ
ncbi:MAG: methionine--tRNA ligase [Planctomycetes bacterium]|nr:methionine--tRNA ligase [Planctomycetota bacterium]